jgi:Uncharacterized conserved protein
MGTRHIASPTRLTLDETVNQLDVWLAHGKVHVVGTDGPARVDVRRVGHKGLTVTQANGNLSIRHDVPAGPWGMGLWWRGRRNWSAEVIIAVPPTTATSLTVVNGDVVASGLRQGTTVDVTSGSIAMMGLGGQVRAKTVSGSIEAVGVSGELTMQTVSGEISLAGSSAEQVYARTISGAITCDLDNPWAFVVHLDTVSGSITVRVPEDANLRVDLAAASGSVTSAFAQVPATNSMGRHSASGQIGAGTGRLRASAVSGTVSLLAGPPSGTDEEPAPEAGRPPSHPEDGPRPHNHGHHEQPAAQPAEGTS